MKKSIIYILTGVVALLLCIGLASAAFTPEFEEMSLSIKNSSPGSPYVDQAFLADAGVVIDLMSNSTVPTGSKLNEVTSTYYQLISDNISPQFIKAANYIVGYLYYASKTGESYQEYQDYKSSASRITDGSEYYALTKQYNQYSKQYWDAISPFFPNSTTFTLPDASAEMPKEEDNVAIGTQLKGLDISLPMEQKDYDPKSPDETGKFKNITIRWFKQYLDDVEEVDTSPLASAEEKNQSPGHRFLTGEGIKWADSTYMDLVGLNVAKTFISKANYIDAFFNYLSQAEEFYSDYAEQQNSFSTMDKGQASYDKSEKYYKEANKTVTYFKDIIPNGTNSTLPDFPKFGEVSKSTFNLGELGNIGKDMSSTLGYDSDSDSPYSY